MKSNLILTGWHHSDCLAATAVAYGHYHGEADVQAVSMDELVPTLERRGLKYQNIDIIGVGLMRKPERLAAAIRELTKGKVKVNYFSVYQFPSEVKAAMAAEGTGFSGVRVQANGSLVKVLSDHFGGVPAATVRRLQMIGSSSTIKIQNYAKGKKKVDGREEDVNEADVWKLLVEAAGFAHRDHGDDDAYVELVKSLSANESVVPKLSERFKKLMDDYQAGYSSEFLGKSACTVATRERLQNAAKFDAHVLILGETGTGKQVAAEYIHGHSVRRERPFRHYNCAYGGSDDMLMTRLFGYAPKAFTGASDKGATGLLDDANGGTLFLDEIGETSEKVQAMLLTVIETGSFVRVGGREKDKVTVDVRLVCATNRDLQRMVLDGEFRLDLYQRIAEFPVTLHPLRSRKEDIEPLVKYYWGNMTGKSATKKQVEALMDYDYPGNVRELISLLKQAKSLNEEDFGKILAEHVAFNQTLLNGLRERREQEETAVVYPDSQEEVLRLHAASVYRKYGRNISRAASAAGISVNTLKKYLRQGGAGSIASMPVLT